MKRCTLWLLALLPYSAAALQITTARHAVTDQYEITSVVLVTNPPRFGLNVEAGAPLPWFPTRIANLWNVMSSMEPYEVRHVHTFGPECTNAGGRIYDAHNNPQETGKPFWHGGLGYWDTVPVGLLDGGRAVIYRNRNGYMEQMHTASVAHYSPQPAGAEFVELDPPPPTPVLPDDIMVIETQYTQWPSQDSVTNEQMRARLNSLGRYGMFAPERASGVDFMIDTAQRCPEGGSTASLKVTFPGGADKGVFQWFSKAGQFQQMFPSGAVFKVQLWLRQQGMASGAVRIRCGNQHTQSVTVGPEWKQYTFSFAVDRAKMPLEGPDKLGVYTEEAGTLWIDNFAVWDGAEPLGAIRRLHRTALQAARPGTLRIWTPLHRNSLDDAIFGDVFTARTEKGKDFDGLNTHQQLALCKEIGADPWLILHPLTSDEELRQLMEYLGAPAGTGWGARRAARGQAEPWSTVFSNIYLECGNETWNSIFTPLAWPGKAHVYAAVANRMFKRIKSSPQYRRESMWCVASGWGHSPAGWTKEVAKLTVEADVVDVAAYFGGSDGLSVKGSGGDDTAIAHEIIKGQLILCGPGLVGQLRHELAAVREELAAKTGRHILLADYESGPGYILPNPGSVFRPRDELIGKSLGMGIVTLDCFLMESALGFVAQNYFKYNVGPNWVTHNNEDEMYPQPSWIALQMRNTHCAGDLMTVRPVARKTVNVPPQELEGWTYDGKPRNVQYKGCNNIPLTECYAFKSGRRHTIVLLNRSWQERRTVELTLPFTPQPAADLYMLAGNPFAGNQTEYIIKERHRRVTGVARTFAINVPPSSAYFLVMQEERGQTGGETATAGVARAAARGDLTALQALLQAGADVASADAAGDTPLTRACMAGQHNAAALLLAAGAAPDQARNPGVTPLLIAAVNNYADIVALLLTNGADITRLDLNYVARWGAEGMSVALVQGGADPGVRLLPAPPALVTACRADKRELARALLARGGDANMRGEAGETLLSMVCTAGNLALAQMLIAHGADATMKDTDGSFPLIKAAQSGMPALVAFLLDSGAQINMTDRNNATAAFGAALQDDAATLRVLMARGADLTIASAWGTPGEYATREGKANAARVLAH